MVGETSLPNLRSISVGSETSLPNLGPIGARPILGPSFQSSFCTPFLVPILEQFGDHFGTHFGSKKHTNTRADSTPFPMSLLDHVWTKFGNKLPSCWRDLSPEHDLCRYSTTIKNHGCSMVLLWLLAWCFALFFCGFSMVVPWLFYGFSIVPPSASNSARGNNFENSMVFHCFSIVFT